MTTPTRIACVLTHNRPEMLRDAVASIVPQVDITLVIDNASDPAVELSIFDGICTLEHTGILIHDPGQPANLPRLWRMGLERALIWTGDRAHIAFVQDDTIVPAGWFDAVVAAMDATGAAAGCSNPFGYDHEPILKTGPDSDLQHRMVGWAFVLDATRELQPDESMPWWWSDTDLDWQARAAGGMVMIGGAAMNVINRAPNHHTQFTPGLAEQAGLDRATFAAKHGWNPW